MGWSKPPGESGGTLSLSFHKEQEYILFRVGNLNCL